MGKTVFITGATSGIGEACAKKFANEGHRLILTGRRIERLVKLKEDLNVDSFIIQMDVRNRKEVEDSISSLPEEWSNIDILLNNAGLASGLELIQDGNPDDWDVMMDTNVKGLLYVSNALIPLLMKSQNAHIINIGSTAGKEVYKNGGVYCASKHAVDAISKSMRIDLLEKGVKVTQVCPGAAETEFSIVRFKGDIDKAKSVYNGYRPMTGEDIAEVVYYCSTLPPHICINDLVLTSTQQANSHYIHRIEH